MSGLYFKKPNPYYTVVITVILELALIYFVPFSLPGFILLALSLLMPVPYFTLVQDLLAKRSLTRPALISRHELKHILCKHKNHVYLGRGFEFTPEHGRRLHELMDEGLAHADDGAHGSPSIHSLTLRNRKNIYQPLRDLNSHTIIFGTTGAGKTRLFDLMTSQAVLRGDTVVVLDPKGDEDLRNGLLQSCVCCDRKSDFFVFDLLDPEAGTQWDVLGSYKTASEIGDRITSLMSGASSSASFKAYANTAITACVICLRILKMKPTPAAIRNILSDVSQISEVIAQFFRDLRINLNYAELNVYYDRISKNGKIALADLQKLYVWLIQKEYIAPNADIELLFSAASMDKQYFQKVTAGALPILNAMSAGKLHATLSSGKGLSFATVMRQRLVIYISLRTLIDSSTGGNIGRLMLSDLCASAGYAYGGKKSRHRISVFIDEASELMCESLIQLMNKSRGAGFALTLATQTIADLSVRGGSKDAAVQMMGNANNLISLRVIDKETARAVTASFPSTRMVDRGSSQAYSENEGIPVNGRITRSISSRPIELFPSEALPLLPDFEYVARFCDGRVMKGRIPLLKD